MAQGFYCSAPSCGCMATADSQFCDVHATPAAKVEWVTETRPDGRKVNVRRVVAS
jgi:hypothetical protein